MENGLWLGDGMNTYYTMFCYSLCNTFVYSRVLYKLILTWTGCWSIFCSVVKIFCLVVALCSCGFVFVHLILFVFVYFCLFLVSLLALCLAHGIIIYSGHNIVVIIISNQFYY